MRYQPKKRQRSKKNRDREVLEGRTWDKHGDEHASVNASNKELELISLDESESRAVIAVRRDAVRAALSLIVVVILFGVVIYGLGKFEFLKLAGEKLQTLVGL